MAHESARIGQHVAEGLGKVLTILESYTATERSFIIQTVQVVLEQRDSPMHPRQDRKPKRSKGSAGYANKRATRTKAQKSSKKKVTKKKQVRASKRNAAPSIQDRVTEFVKSKGAHGALLVEITQHLFGDSQTPNKKRISGALNALRKKSKLQRASGGRWRFVAE